MREQAIFVLKECLAIGICRERAIVQRKKQSVFEGHPQKSRRRNAGSERNAIGQHGFDAQLVQHPIGIAFAFLSDPVRPRRIPKYLARGFGGQRRSGARASGFSKQLHVFDGERVVAGVTGRGQDGMGVIVDGLDFGDLGGDCGIDLDLPVDEGRKRQQQAEQLHSVSKPRCHPRRFVSAQNTERSNHFEGRLTRSMSNASRMKAHGASPNC